MHQPQYTHGDDSLYVADETYAPRRRPRATVVAGAALAVLVLVPVAVDRVAAARVESRTARAFQEGMNTPLAPTVHVRGFPVLPQAVSGTLQHVDVTAHDIPADGSARPLPVTELGLKMEDLRKSDDDGEARARSAEATAYLSYTDVSDTLGLEVSQGSHPGEVGASILMPLRGEVTVTTTVSALPGNRITFGDFQVVSGVLPGAGRALLNKAFEEPIQLRNIPDGLRLRSVTTTADGLSAHFSGKSVTFRPDGSTRDESSGRSA